MRNFVEYWFCLNIFRTFHLLDSLRNNSVPTRDAKHLQNALLRYYKDVSFDSVRISTNVAHVV